MNIENAARLSNELAEDEDFDTEWTFLAGRDLDGQPSFIVVIAKGEAAREFLPIVENFEARGQHAPSPEEIAAERDARLRKARRAPGITEGVRSTLG